MLFYVDLFCLFMDDILGDIYYIKENDPSMKYIYMILLFHIGFHSLFLYRLSHLLFKLNLEFLSLCVWRLNSMLNSCDIHPKALIKSPCMIDHSIGIVIGETAMIDERCQIFQGVTLGGRKQTTIENRRHPMIGKNVLLGCNCIILGPIMIGNYCKIGSGSVVIENIPSNTTVVGIPCKIITNIG